MSERRTKDPVPSSVYSEEYFLSDACEGFNDFLSGGISQVKERELELLDVRPGCLVLDLGCGRGEVLAALAERGAHGVGIDYAEAAVRLAQKRVGVGAPLSQADGTALPFRDDCFDRILLGDVIEHLPWDMGVQALREVGRVLAPGGLALVHTAPNRWFSEGLFPLAKIGLRAVGRRSLVERMEDYESRRAHVHPNELSPLGLRRLMREAGLPARVWVDPDVLRSGASDWTADLSTSKFMRAGGRVAGAWPFRLVLGNDLYARVTPTE